MNRLIIHPLSRSAWLGLTLLLLLTACGNRFEDLLKTQYDVTQTSLKYLDGQLNNQQLTNALLVRKYADELASLKPDYADMASLFKKEAGTDGNLYKGLQRRLAAVNLQPTSDQAAQAAMNELILIDTAADPFEFNSALADVANTMASLSDGKLAVVDVPASEKPTASRTNALIGNPSYGQWKTGSDGRSFWEWYGMYAAFSHLFGGRSYYDSWSARPSYSYYNRYGRNRWGSDFDVTRNYNLSSRYPSRYNKPTASTKTRYSSSAARTSSYGSGSGSKSSGGSSSSKYSSYGSSSRSSSYSSSRGSFSGK